MADGERSPSGAVPSGAVPFDDVASGAVPSGAAAFGDVASRAAVLGSPVAHSLSPMLYRAGFAAAGLAGWSFQAIECGAEDLPDLVLGLDSRWAGLAVTMPGKAAAVSVAASRSERVAVLGVANTLLRRGDGWHAENTDVDGVRGSLAAAGVVPAGPVLLLGGGGTALAVVAALAELHWSGPLTIAGRRPASTVTAVDLARRLGLDARPAGLAVGEITASARNLTLAVSTVPAGAADHLAGVLGPVPAVLDVVYHPWPTPLAAAGASGRITVTGLDMLLHQALVQFELITGAAAPAGAMRAALRAAVGTDLPLPI